MAELKLFEDKEELKSENAPRSLYKISEDYYEVLKIIDSIEEKEYLDESVWLALEDVESELEKKMENYSYIMKRFQHEADFLSEEIKRLKDRRDLRLHKIDWLKENIKNVLLGLDIKKIETPEVTVRIQNSPMSVQIKDESKVPSKFKELEMVTKIKKSDILKYVKESGDESVPGCTFNRGTSLRIS